MTVIFHIVSVKKCECMTIHKYKFRSIPICHAVSIHTDPKTLIQEIMSNAMTRFNQIERINRNNLTDVQQFTVGDL
jgi:hypothetical protein